MLLQLKVFHHLRVDMLRFIHFCQGIVTCIYGLFLVMYHGIETICISTCNFLKLLFTANGLKIKLKFYPKLIWNSTGTHRVPESDIKVSVESVTKALVVMIYCQNCE